MADGDISLLAIYDRIAAVDAKITEHIAKTDERLEHGGKRMDDHETRIRSLEKWRWQLVGALLLVNALAAYAGYLLAHK